MAWYVWNQVSWWRGTTQKLQIYRVLLVLLFAAHIPHLLYGYFGFPFGDNFSRACTHIFPHDRPDRSWYETGLVVVEGSGYTLFFTSSYVSESLLPNVFETCNSNYSTILIEIPNDVNYGFYWI